MPTAFWDATALVPLCVEEQATHLARTCLRKFSPVVWWGSVVEVHSAIARVRRDGLLTQSQRDGAIARLELLRSGWREILPDDALRSLAARLLDEHSVRSADAMQLAASLVWCQNKPAQRTFVCGDLRLCAAAVSAGFLVVSLTAPSPSTTEFRLGRLSDRLSKSP